MFALVNIWFDSGEHVATSQLRGLEGDPIVPVLQTGSERLTLNRVNFARMGLRTSLFIVFTDMARSANSLIRK